MPSLPIVEFPLRSEWPADYTRRDQLPLQPGPLVYEPLPAGEARLLILYPGDDAAPVHCALYSRPLYEAAGRYVALSYAWGDLSVTEPIYVDGHAFQATTNLAVALRHIRRKLAGEQTAVLWVDAVCIDRTNAEERATKIRMMWDIYESAALVLCWLGEDGEQGLDYLRELGNFALGRGEDSDSRTRPPSRCILPPALVRERQLAIRDAAATFQNTYWRRVWTAQAYSVPTPSIFMCGGAWMNSDVFPAAAQLYKQALLLLPLAPDEWGGDGSFIESTLRMVDSILQDQKIIGGQLQRIGDSEDQGIGVDEDTGGGARRFAFLSLLQLLRGRGATDPRDRIYAPLSLAFDEPEAKAAIPIDYTKPVAELYMDVARYCLADQAWPLGILELCRWGSSRDLPSWVPDWRVLPRKILSRSGSTGGQLFAASRGCFMDVDVPVWEVLPNNFLRLQGHLVDRVEMMWTPVFSEDSAHGRFEGWIVDDAASRQSASQAGFPAYMSRVGIGEDRDDRPVTEDGARHVDADEVELIPKTGWRATPELTPRLNRRRLARSNRGFIGIVPAEIDTGDELWLLRGGHMFYALRKQEAEHVLIGEAYLHGLMHGEISRTLELPNQPEQVTIR